MWPCGSSWRSTVARSSIATLLALLGCADMSRARAGAHLDALAEVFDAAKSVVKTPFPFAADISEAGRPVAIDGSRELIERGCQAREAVFWMVVTYARCLKVLYQDAPAEMQDRYNPGLSRDGRGTGDTVARRSAAAQRTSQRVPAAAVRRWRRRSWRRILKSQIRGGWLP